MSQIMQDSNGEVLELRPARPNDSRGTFHLSFRDAVERLRQRDSIVNNSENHQAMARALADVGLLAHSNAESSPFDTIQQLVERALCEGVLILAPVVRRLRPICDQFDLPYAEPLIDSSTAEPLTPEPEPPEAVAWLTIDNPRAALVKKDHQAHAPRVRVTVRVTDTATQPLQFDGTITLNASDPSLIEIHDSEEGGSKLALPLEIPGAEAARDKEYWIEAKKPSASKEDLELEVTLEATGTHTVSSGGKAKDTMTCVELTLDICLAPDPANPGATPAVMDEAPKVDSGRYIHVQASDPLPVSAGAPAPAPADRLPHERAKVIVRAATPADWEGTLTLTPCDGKGVTQGPPTLELFEQEMAAKSQAAKSTPLEIEHLSGYTDRVLWLQGKATSKALKDSGLKLGVKGLRSSRGEGHEGDRVVVTVMKVELGLCKSRSVKAASANDAPDLFSHKEKHQIGRFVHKQYAEHHGRGGLLVETVEPADFRGKLELTVWDVATARSGTTTFELFEQEVPGPGQAAAANPLVIDYNATFPPTGRLLWAQAKGVSSSLRDTQVRLSLPGHINLCDLAPLTAVEFKEMKVDIPSTPAVTARAGNSPVPRHAFDHARPPANASYDHDFTNNEAIVLVEDSVKASDKVKLSVTIDPAAAKDFVRWHTNRDKRVSAPKGDHPTIVALPGNTPDPALATQDAADPLKATMMAGAVGSFHVHPYIDQNGSNTFDFDDASDNRIDREPFLCLNVVLVRVQGVRNNSIATPGNAAVVPPAPSSATGVRIRTGGWTTATTGAYSKATARVIGGGDDGRRGLDQVFSGWAQHIGATGTSVSAPQGLDIFAEYRHQLPPIAPWMPAPAPMMHRQFFIFTQSGPAGTVFGPGLPAPTVEPAPVLDVTPLGIGADGVGGDSCTGQWGGHGSITPITKTNRAIGQDWVIDTLDSPSVGLGPAHPNFPGTLVSFRFNIDFRVDLLFWTNKSKVATDSPDPAPRLYSSVQTNNWDVRFSISFNPTTGAPIGAVPAVAITMNRDPNPTRRSTPVDGMGLETRFPTALGLFSRDARA